MIKTAGIVRKVDELGRVVIPVEVRRVLGISKFSGLEIYVDNEMIILKKYVPGCTFCGNIEVVKKVNGKNVCASCLKKLHKLA